MQMIRVNRFKILLPAVVIFIFLIINAPVQSYGESYKKIVVLYPAVSPVLKTLGAENKVVGTTRTDKTFTDKVQKVGSHLRPNVELIKALEPDMLIVGSKKASPPELINSIVTDKDIKVFNYDPRTLNEILDTIEALGVELGKKEEALLLIKQLREKLEKVRPLTGTPKVVYEIMETPLRVAGTKSVVNDIIEIAGGVNIIKTPKKHVLSSIEVILKENPDFYLYQVGPMNKNPSKPKSRPQLRSLTGTEIRVNEFEFARPGINAFDAVVELNSIFISKGYGGNKDEQ